MILAIIAGLFSIAVLAIYFGWGSFVKLGIASDLNDYQQVVERSRVPPPVRQRLAEQLRRMRERVRQAPPGFMEWVTAAAPVKELLDDGSLEEEEVVPLEQALDRLEAALH